MATKTPPKSTPPKNAQPVAKSAPAPVKAAPAKAPAPAAKTVAVYRPSHDEIAARAFEIFEREGGSEHDNWLRAERDLIERGRR